MPFTAAAHRAWLTPRRLMAASVGVALLTMALKTGAWWVTGSVGLLSDAMESGVNLAAAVFGLWMVTVAAQPADAEHPFGHEKAEYFSSGFEGMLILVAAGAIAWTALPRLWRPEPLQAIGWGLALSVLSSALNGLLAWLMFDASRRHRSIALEADARHLLTDVWTSAGVLGGLLLVGATGWLWLDPLLAIGVALNIVWHGVQLVRRSVHGLMDTALDADELAQIRAVLARFALHQGGRPVVRFDHLRTRKSGQRRFAELHLHVPAQWTLAQADAWRKELEAALVQAVPGLHASLQLLPQGVEPLGAELGVPAVAPEPPAASQAPR